ncbi:MAG: NB-ARC domain-containing protein, partial [Waterburya sp.]
MVATWKQVITTAPPEKKDPSEEIEKGNAFSNQILILFSEPLLPETATESLAVQREIEAIVEALEKVSYPISVEIVVKVATAENIQNIFHQRVRPLIIHFIGHGLIKEGNTALVLENEVGRARHFDERELAIALAYGNGKPCQLAVINSCHSGKLAEAIAKAEVPHVIAVNAQETILNEAARCFAKSLYKNLFEQNSVQNSFSIGRNAIILDRELQEKFNLKTHQKGVNIDEAYKFQLLPENQHHSAELDFESAWTQEINYPNLFDTNLPPQDPKFIGRKQDIHSVVDVFTRSDNRCVVLHGMGGIGKTSLAKAIGRWFQQRDRFKDGVWLINAEDIDSIRNLIIKIQQELKLKNLFLVKELRRKKILLILDDLDLLINNDNELKELIGLINYLIENCRYLKILITTRKTLVSNIELCYQQEVHSMVNWTETLFSKYTPLNLNNQWKKEPNYSENKQRLRLFFDGYPLAIKLAAAYVKDKGNISLAKLCEDLDIKPLKVLEIESP